MKKAGFLAELIAANPQLFENMPEARARRLANAVIRQIGARIDRQTDEGRVNVPGLGFFVVRKVAPGEGAAPVRRVVFRRVKAAPKAAPGAKPKAAK